MPLIDTQQLEYYADVFERGGYGRYLTLPQFLNDPEGWMDRFDTGQRPLLPTQREVQRHMDALDLIDDTGIAVDRLERELEGLPMRNGRVMEPLKHHRNEHR